MPMGVKPSSAWLRAVCRPPSRPLAHGDRAIRSGRGVRLRRLADRTIIWTHVQFAVASLAGSLTAMGLAPFPGSLLTVAG